METWLGDIIVWTLIGLAAFFVIWRILA